MEISETLSSLVMDALRSMAQNGAKANADSKEIETLRVVVREQLRREMRYNAELLNEQKLHMNVRALNLETAALDLAFNQGVPLSILLNRTLSEDTLRTAAGDSKKHAAHLLQLKTEAELIERTLHRIRMVQIRAKYDLGLGDVPYLRKLIVASHLSLS